MDRRITEQIAIIGRVPEYEERIAGNAARGSPFRARIAKTGKIRVIVAQRRPHGRPVDQTLSGGELSQTTERIDMPADQRGPGGILCRIEPTADNGVRQRFINGHALAYYGASVHRSRDLHIPSAYERPNHIAHGAHEMR